MSNYNKIAIIGVSCRFPGGVENLDDYWQILKNGEDVVTEIPASRWSKEIYGHPKRKVPGHSYTWAAGVLSQIDQFDAAFFGISRREANQMDPQQRLLLELAWEAIEDAGLCADKLAGSDCGVFVGLGSHDYSLRRFDDLGSMDAYSMTGNTGSIGSNRISYIFDLRGPSMSIDTACSSSLVALHQACNSIRSGESSMAITGGVNMLLHPSAFVGFSKASMLSPSGRCRAFDASGDGYVRSEGAALVILKSLAQAEADGNPIYAVISASGANCDGKTNGIALPSSDAQTALLDSLYQQTAIDINDVVYIEAHGTGTAVGDPLETKALWQALSCKRRLDNPLLMGSAKTNLGHLEVASGMAGLLKTILCLKHRAIPKNLHFKTPNPHIPFQEWNLKVVDKFTPISETKKPLLMGINSFGFGGANAHVLLEEYQTPPYAIPLSIAKTPPLFLSARHPKALKALANHYAQWLETVNAEDYYNIAWSALTHRQTLEQRVVVFANNTAEVAQKLQRFAEEQGSDGVVCVEALAQTSEVAFVYSGNGSQWLGMGCVLFKENKVFRTAIKDVDNYWCQYADFSIIDALFADAESSKLALTEVAQPTLFAIQVGLTQLLGSLGIKATAVFGHSVGEVAAAWAAGALTLKQAVHVIYERSYAQALTKGQGKMAAVGLSAEVMTEIITTLQIVNQVVIAGINSPNSVTISGDEHALHCVETQMLADNVFYKLLDLDYAFHSPYMDSIEQRVLNRLAPLKPRNTQNIRFISTVTGKDVVGTDLTADYWWHNIRYPVAFSAAVQHLITDDVRIFIEIGSHPVLCRYVEQCLQHQEKIGRAIALVKRQEESVAAITASVYHAHLLGASIDLSIAFPHAGRSVKLPAYPWQREHYWTETSENTYPLINRQMDNRLLGYRLNKIDTVWETSLDTVLLPWLADHEVGGAIVLPAAVYIEMALAASKAWLNGAAFEVEELDIAAPIVLDADHVKSVTFKINPVDGTFTIRSRDYISHNVTGRLLGTPMQKSARLIAIPALIDAPKKHTASQHYQLTQKIGLNYGVAFQGIDDVWLWPEQKIVWARLVLPKNLQADYAQYLLHPSLLDSCFQLLADMFSEQIEAGQRLAMIPIRVGKLKFYGGYGQPTWCKLELKRYNRRSVVADFKVLDGDYNTVAVLNSVRFRSVNFSKGAEHYPATYFYITKLMPHLQPLIAAPIPSFKSLVTVAINALKAKENLLKREQHFNEVLPLFDVLASVYCWEALNTLMGEQRTASLNELVRKNGIAERHIDLLLRMLAIVKEDNLASYHAEQWTLVTDTEMPESVAIWRTILADYPQYLPELTLIAQCGTHLVDVLCEKIQPHALLYPPKSSTQEHLYSNSQSWVVANQIIVDILHHCVQQWPNNRRLRILEVGDGHCELTRMLMSFLPNDRCDYVFIDAEDDSVFRATALFERVEFFNAQTLSLENLPIVLPELLPLQSFDIVIASNSFYKSNDLEKTLTHARQFLVNGGMLIVQERASDRFTDLTCGLEPDWWLYNEETGVTSARLLSSTTWLKLLEQQGFSETKAIIEAEALNNQGAFVIVAKNTQNHCVSEMSIKSARWLLLIDADEAALTFYQHLKNCLNLAGQEVIALQAGLENTILNPEHFVFNPRQPESLAQTLAQLDEYVHIVNLQGWQQAENPLDAAATQQRCELTINLLQMLEKNDSEKSLSLWLITQGAAVYEHSEIQGSLNPSQAALWGLGRVIMNEYPNLNVRLLDLIPLQSSQQTAQLLSEEFLHAGAENEIVLNDSVRKVMRMQRCELKSGTQKTKKTPVAMLLDFKIAGSLNNLYWHGLDITPDLAVNQIQIRPMASGLNFRDVMYAMGMLSDEAVENGFAGASLGMELSGIVERVGKSVQNFRVGDEVICFAPACFSNRVITQTTAVALKPKHWSHEQATTVPTTFFTVYYALHYLARLQPGEKVLIHGAAGGVGLAAIQYAQYIGAEIFATAGTEEKRAFVKMMGVDYVMDSRSMAFADEIMVLTEGKGVDVVLNSLSGEAIWRNLAILKPFGRFLELGKRDFYENSKIGLRPFRNNISYYGIDADQLLIERQELAAHLFQEMMQLFTAGFLKPLPFRVFPASQIVDAFRYMQQSRQIGKVVVSFNEIENLKVQGDEPQSVSLKLNSKGSYLVTGGLGGFGLKTAQWLVEKGAKHLILLGRSGLSHPIAVQAVQDMRAQGIRVEAYAIDVCDLASLQLFFVQIADSVPPLKGIIHAAAVIDDALIRQLTSEHLSRVLAPKIRGSWNLHQLTEKMDLDFFVLYSSMTTFLGNPGQANYVVANSYLESLAHYRRANGLVGTYVAWGAIEDVGFLTRNEAVKKVLESRLGSKAIHSNTALAMLEKILVAGSSGAAVVNFDWRTISRFMPAAKSPKYEQQLLQAKNLGSDSHNHENIKSLLSSLAPEEAINLIAQLLAQEVGQILRLPAEKIDKQKSVFDLGMDSLMGMELAIAIEDRFEVKLPLMALAEGATISKLATRIAELIEGNTVTDENSAQQDIIKALANRHEESFSEEIVNALLEQMTPSTLGNFDD